MSAPEQRLRRTLDRRYDELFAAVEIRPATDDDRAVGLCDEPGDADCLEFCEHHRWDTHYRCKVCGWTHVDVEATCDWSDFFCHYGHEDCRLIRNLDAALTRWKAANADPADGAP